MSQPDYSTHLQRLGIDESEVSPILEAVAFSVGRLDAARKALADQKLDGITVSALGSLGRYEANEPSDLDLAFVFDPELIEPARADDQYPYVCDGLRLAGFDIPEKTFFRPVSISSLTNDVGGSHETNEQLTYRALLLTEAAFIYDASLHAEFRSKIFRAYADRPNTAGRHLTSLANDLHRYYRTLCVDYRWKVEEQGKRWAIRLLKLRHSRKLWHLSNIVAQCKHLSNDSGAQAAQPPGGVLSQELEKPPLLRLADSMLGDDAIGPVRDIFISYSYFLEQLAKPGVRRELDEVTYEDRDQSDAFAGLEKNADRLQDGANRVLAVLEQNVAAKAYIRRFVIL